MDVSQKLKNKTHTHKNKNRITMRLSNSTPGYVSENNNANLKSTCTPMFLAAIFKIAKIQKQPKCPSTDEWIKKMHVCIHVYTYKCTQWNITQQ